MLSRTRDLFWRKYVSGLALIDHTISLWLGALGSKVAKYPVLTIVLSLAVSIGLASGLLFLDDVSEDRIERLWVPQASISRDHKAFMQEWFGETDRTIQFMFESKQGSVVTVAATDEMFAALDMILDVQVPDQGRNIKLKEVCLLDTFEKCRQSGYLSFWSSDQADYFKVVGGNQDALIESVNNVTRTNGLGAPLVPKQIFGESPNEGGKVFEARVVYQSYAILLAEDDEVLVDWANAVEDLFYPDGNSISTFQHINVYLLHPKSVANAVNESLRGDDFLIYIALAVISLVSVLVLTQADCVYARSILALMGVTSVFLAIAAGFGVCMLIGIPYTPITRLLVFILLGVGVNDMFGLVSAMEDVEHKYVGLTEPERFRKLLETGGISTTVTSLANMAAFALGSITTISAIQWFCWYAIFVLAIDWVLQLTFFMACFVLTERRIEAARYELFCCFVRPQEAAVKARNAGYRFVGPLAPYIPSEHGSEFSDDGPLGDAVVDETGVKVGAPAANDDAVPTSNNDPSVPTSDESTRAPAKAVKGPKGQPDNSDLKREQSTEEVPLPSSKTTFLSACKLCLKKGILTADEGSILYFLLVKHLRPVLLHPATVAVVLALGLGSAIFGAVGLTNLGEGLPMSDVAPDGHYIKRWHFEFETTFAQQVGITGEIMFRGLDQSNPKNQLLMLDSWNELLNEYSYFDAELSPDLNWLTALHQWTQTNDTAAALPDGTVIQEGFYERLKIFLEVEPGWRADLANVGKNGFPLTDIEVSKFPYVHIKQKAGDDKYDRLLLINAQAAEADLNMKYFRDAQSKYEKTVILYAPNYVFWEANLVILSELLFNLGFAVIGVIIIAFMLLVHPIGVLVLAVGIVTVDLILFAEMYVLQINLNTVSVTNIVMAVGLAVDFSVGIVHNFLSIHGLGRKTRVAKALGKVGPTILVGVLTTTSGILVLGGASSKVFRIFFALLLGTVVFGVLVGLVYVPILLRLIGPNACLSGGPNMDHVNKNEKDTARDPDKVADTLVN